MVQRRPRHWQARLRYFGSYPCGSPGVGSVIVGEFDIFILPQKMDLSS